MTDSQRSALDLEIDALRARLRDIEQVILLLERLHGAPVQRRRRGRKSVGSAEREAISARMKKYWKTRKERQVK
jgi:hypothetical protein